MLRHLRLLIVLGTIAASSIFTATNVHAQDADGVPVVSIAGSGHGHGVGMSQWGAYSMALDGASAADIIGQFYPGTTIATATGEIVVGLVQRPTIAVSLPQGGELRSARSGPQAEGFPIPLAPGQVVHIAHDGSGYRVIGDVHGASGDGAVVFTGDMSARRQCVVLCDDGGDDAGDDPGDGEDAPPADEGGQPDEEAPEESCLLCGPTTTTTPPAEDGDDADDREDAPEQAPAPEPTVPLTTTTTAPPPPEPEAPRSPTPVWAVPVEGGTVTSHDRGRTYRGSFEVVGSPGALRLRNHVDVEHYLMGMAEVPGTWPAAAVQAQAVAARTYALRAMAAGGEICDSESCQVYTGVSHESAGQRAAVEATRGWVVTYGGGLAATFYSASGGGHSATIGEGFGSEYDLPYLQALPYDTDNPKDWAVDVALHDVARRLGYPGTVTDVRVSEIGPSGRATAMELDGDAGPMPVDPQDFRRRLGLQSTLFAVSTGIADEAPPPPPDADVDEPGAASLGDPELEVAFTSLVDGRSSSTAAIGALRTGDIRDGRPSFLATVAVVLIAMVLAHGWRSFRRGELPGTPALAAASGGAGRIAALAQARSRLSGWTSRIPNPMTMRRRMRADETAEAMPADAPTVRPTPATADRLVPAPIVPAPTDPDLDA